MKRFLLFSVFAALSFSVYARPVEVRSPSGKIAVAVDVQQRVNYSVYADGVQLLKDCSLGLAIDGVGAWDNPRLLRQKITAVKRDFSPVFPFKSSVVTDSYNLLRMDFRGGWSLEVRAYDDGMAYRIITALGGQVEIAGEEFSLGFPGQYSAVVQQPGGFKTSCEEFYATLEVAKWNTNDRFSTLPVLIDTRKGYKMLLSETGLEDYPCMFVRGDGKGGINGVFPRVPLEFGDDGDRSVKILREADYIAKTTGTRAFPWRWMLVTSRDGELIENTMPSRLAPDCALTDVSWIKPGQVSWEWWNGASPYGTDVNFEAGFNMNTYKYFIDFASKFDIPYIIMDEGWALSTRDPYTPNPTVDVHEIIRYGKEKGVGVVLWLTWLTVDRNMELFERFAQWGVAGVKVDFMDRSDQWMVNYYERVAERAAKNHLFISFHGAFKPAGLEYKYPNVLTYEGVRGMEYMGGCLPSNSVWYPFMRNSVGPMDYTPGAMLSMQPEVYRAERPNSASIGTRAYQMALFVIFESGLQMLADNPTLYYREKECTEFMSSVPVTWDETRALAARAGEYAVVAKRKGDKWYIGGMNGGNDVAGVELDISLDFLTSGRSYAITSFEDGINSSRQAMDYRKKTGKATSSDTLKIKMTRNGGYAAVIE